MEDDAQASQNRAASFSPWLAMLILTVAFGAAYYFLIFSKALVELELETNTRTVLKFYWPNQEGQYSEKRAVLLPIKPGKTNYAVRVADFSRLDHLRLDPSENKTAKITIRRIAVQQNGFPSWQLSSKADFANLRVTAGVKSVIPLEQGGIALEIHENDPQLELALPKLGERKVSWPEELGRGLIIVLLAAGCCLLSCFVAEFIPLLAAFALALVLTMAGISAVNTHPDESMHIAAGAYYQTHILPPKVGDPAIVQTYSLYGVSRLHSGEIYYLLAGKFLRLFDAFQLKPHLALRLFNVLLFFLLILHGVSREDFRFFLLPILISPQIWYVFSYVNSDALAVFTSLAAAHQLAAEHSALNAMLRNEPKKHGWAVPLLLGLFLGLLLLQKKNFYFSCLFFFFYFFWRLWITGHRWKSKAVLRLIALILTGSSLFLAVRFADSWVNDFRKKELVRQAREQYADYAHKPSTPLAHKHPYLYMRDRDNVNSLKDNVNSLKKMLTVDRWGEKTFRSSFGVYGYTQYSAPFAYYNYVRTAIILLLLTLCASVLCRGGWGGITLLGIFGSCALLLVGTTIYKSWTLDFQTQGRYLLPMVPMFAVLCHHCRQLVIKPIFYGLILILFLLSAYSFVFVGLLEIGKAVFL